MVEFISCLILASLGYIIGFFIGWVDGNNSPYRRRVATPVTPKRRPTLCQDYSHLKKKAMVERLSKISLAHMPSQNVYEKVYEAEVVEDEIRINKAV
jgi:hypothetical protein